MAETKKYDFVDALRGWAVLGVIVSHTPIPGDLGITLTIIGSKGVQLFYVLSAFTLFLSHSQKIGVEARPLRNFFIRRFFRIAPMFYVAALFFLWLNGTGPSFWAPHGLSWWHVALTFTFLNGWHPETINTIVPGGWSVAVETLFYLFLPALYLVASTQLRALALTVVFLFGGVALSAAVGRYWMPQYTPGHEALVGYFQELWLPSQAAVFTLGASLYFLFKSPRQPRAASVRATVSAALLVLVPIALFAIARARRLEWFPLHFQYALLFVALAYGLSLKPYRLFVNGPMKYLGKISYSFYLLHSIGIRLGEGVAERLDIKFVGATGTLLVFGIALPVSIVLASLAYRWIELPGMAVGKRWIARSEREAVELSAFAARPG